MTQEVDIECPLRHHLHLLHLLHLQLCKKEDLRMCQADSSLNRLRLRPCPDTRQNRATKKRDTFHNRLQRRKDLHLRQHPPIESFLSRTTPWKNNTMFSLLPDLSSDLRLRVVPKSSEKCPSNPHQQEKLKKFTRKNLNRLEKCLDRHRRKEDLLRLPEDDQNLSQSISAWTILWVFVLLYIFLVLPDYIEPMDRVEPG